MKKLFTIIFLIAVIVQSSAQEFTEKPTIDEPIPRLSQYRIEYPIGENGENFKNGQLNYQISKKLSAQLERFYGKFGTHEQIQASFRLKWYVRDKVYVFAGTENQYDVNQITGKHELLRVNLNLGVGYEVKDDVLLEFGYHPEIGSTRVDQFGRKVKKQNSFSLRARF